LKTLFAGIFFSGIVGGAPVQETTGPNVEHIREASASADAGRTGHEFVVHNSDGDPVLRLPPEETLVYSVHVDIAVFEAAVGTVTQTSRIEPYRQSVLLPTADSLETPLEAATLQLHAEGSYLTYALDSVIEVRHLPQIWPRIFYHQAQKGTKVKRRENLIGTRQGSPTSSYRRDTSKNAPEGTRIWKEPEYREIPPDALDMLSAVFAARTLVREGLSEMTFPMVEKDRLWEFTLRRGRERRIETASGSFDAVEVKLEPKPWEGEVIDAEKVAKFEGLFGMRGTIRLWADAKTGVAVRIQGDLPAGILTLGVDIVLESFEGTPAEFAPVYGSVRAK